MKIFNYDLTSNLINLYLYDDDLNVHEQIIDISDYPIDKQSVQKKYLLNKLSKIIEIDIKSAVNIKEIINEIVKKKDSEIKKERQKKYYQENKEKLATWQREYYRANRQELNEKKKAYNKNKNVKEKLRKYNSEYYRKNKEEISRKKKEKYAYREIIKNIENK